MGDLLEEFSPEVALELGLGDEVAPLLLLRGVLGGVPEVCCLLGEVVVALACGD
jgi:hypothetical protein